MTVEGIFHINKLRFVWANDSSTFGKEEYWANYEELMASIDAGKIRGDCDDFAEVCVHQLRENGYPARFVICYTELGECHLVAESHGLILDNRQEFVVPQDILNYTWIAASGFKAGDAWRLIVDSKDNA